ncbi:hypothetical protein OG21DRAFT_386383 [Imleria badia]|nr:hypothetical protein OG21DRAFT_386383 [Imleria badia]
MGSIFQVPGEGEFVSELKIKIDRGCYTFDCQRSIGESWSSSSAFYSFFSGESARKDEDDGCDVDEDYVPVHGRSTNLPSLSEPPKCPGLGIGDRLVLSRCLRSPLPTLFPSFVTRLFY